MADIVLILVAVVLMGFYIHDRSRPEIERPILKAPARWMEEVATGIRTGPPDAVLTVIEFMDFECPFRARWAARMDTLLAEYPSKVRLATHHFPLGIHGHAMAAAVAVECADRQGVSSSEQ